MILKEVILLLFKQHQVMKEKAAELAVKKGMLSPDQYKKIFENQAAGDDKNELLKKQPPGRLYNLS